MARKKNSSFAGVRIPDADPSSPTFARAIEDIAGDVALVYDKITGENSEANTVNHAGNPASSTRGAMLGIPIVNQYIGRRLTMWDSSATKDGGEGETNIYAVPFFLPGGTSSGEADDLMLDVFFTFDVPSPDLLNPYVVIYDTASFTETVRKPLQLDSSPRAGGLQRLFCDLSGEIADGGTYVLFVRMTPYRDPPNATSAVTYDVEVGTFQSICLRSTRMGNIANTPQRLSTSPFSVWTPGTTEGLGHRNFDAAHFTDRYSLNAFALIGLDRNLNALLEYLTGWPAGGNASYTHVDHDSGGSPDSTDPARSRFFAHTRSLYASEPQVDFPLVVVGCGAFKTDGGLVVEAANPPTFGMTDWYAPWPTTTAALAMDIAEVVFPDFQTSSSALKGMILVGSDGAADVGTDWTGSFLTTAGTTTCGAFTALDANNRYWLASASAVSFTADTRDGVNCRLQKTAGALEAIDQIVLLGWCLYFDP
ncbi:MAG: hypothetical protein VW362_03205 [Candidatus Nanopelagicales bacterium]